MGFIALLAVAALVSPPRTQATEVVHWSPLTASGTVKPALKVRDAGTGDCVDTYTTAGDIAYRCGRGRFLYFPCWRQGPSATDYVLCIGDPWTRRVTRLRSPGLLLYPGVTYLDDPYAPWAVELASGERCRLVQGAHDAVHRGARMYVVDYGCDKRNLVLLRGVRRGRVWRIGAARYLGPRRGYELLGERAIRRAYFGGLPPAMERQRRLAALAVAAARRLVHRDHPRAHLDLTWVRLTLPDATWAYVIFSSTGGKGWFALLRRKHDAWREASAERRYCRRLPVSVQRQLFLRPHAPADTLAPPGEQRC
jgi:hypothetical protein